ncbi:hypothetical protein [Flammeovirga sp. EKP202]|uniref:hypothetical protein n=1 Tax=Flammeovirga sp. EKP202 TaxID=2770592 RepID=UPI00165F0846|nr:hypothetical protein [Flammeovirga sp. EKP202]MBD0402962.1 hypothetical protein [Flammeovirga sp. EKP202]
MKFITPSILLLFLLQSCSPSEETWTKEEILNNVSEHNYSGTGYRDFEGKVINYDYVDFGSFRLAVYDNKIKWKGYGGYFDGIVALVEPQISKVSEGVYFMSWVFESGGGDNVCVNFNTKKVYAHLHQPESDMPEDFELIYGEITCGPSKDCAFPDGEPMGQLSTIWSIFKNIMKYDLPFLGETERPLIQENKLAQKELTGKKIKYTIDNTSITIEIKNEVTQVTYQGEETQNFLTYVTKVGPGIYFISWMGNRKASDHIVFNQNEMIVFDHISRNGEHRESVYDVDCFGENYN